MNSEDFRSLLIRHDFDNAQRALDEGLDLAQIKDSRSRDMVHWALARGDAAIVHWVLDRQPHLVMKPGETTLIALANRMSDTSVAERLLRLGGEAQLEDHDARGLTPLMRALQQRPRNGDLCRMLIERGANVNAQSSKAKDSVLMIALNEGHHGLLADLAAHGADPNVPNAQGEVAAHVAVAAQDERVLDAFLKAFPHADLNRPANSGTPPIMRLHTPETAVRMLRAGADPNVRSANRYDDCHTLLMCLAKMPEADEPLGLALEKGADPNLEDINGCTAAGHAARCGHIHFLWPLYEHGVDPKEPLDREGISPYHATLHASDVAEAVSFIQDMAQLGVPVDVGCRPGHVPLSKRHPSPLFLALKQGMNEHARAFLAAGASPDQPGPNGAPALHALGAWAAHHEQRVLLLDRNAARVGGVRVGADDTNAAKAKVESQQRLGQEKQEAEAAFDATWQALLDTHPNWNAVDPQGRTCLDAVAKADQASFGLRLLQAGVSPTLTDPEGFNAMDRALFSGSVRSLHAWKGWLDATGQAWAPNVGQLVLDSPDSGQARQDYLRGLEGLSRMAEWSQWVNRADDQGNTPLILAAATRQDDLVRFLLTHGADATLANAAGETALHHAVTQYAREVIEHLRAAGASVDHADAQGQTPRSLGAANNQVGTSLGTPRPAEAAWREGEALAEQVEEGRALAQASLSTANPTRRRRLQG